MLPAWLPVPVFLAFTYPPRAPIITAQGVPGATSLRSRRASVAIATETRPKFTTGPLGKVLGTRSSDEVRVSYELT